MSTTRDSAREKYLELIDKLPPERLILHWTAWLTALQIGTIMEPGESNSRKALPENPS